MADIINTKGFGCDVANEQPEESLEQLVKSLLMRVARLEGKVHRMENVGRDE